VAPTQTEPLNFQTFWSLLARLVTRQMRERAHAEIVLIIQDGNIRQVRVNRSYLPANLPEG
jgi:hypothetical protein